VGDSSQSSGLLAHEVGGIVGAHRALIVRHLGIGHVQAAGRSGALPCSTHRSMTPSRLGGLGPSPPVQCAMPRAMNKRSES
jgi:hypothetical protein